MLLEPDKQTEAQNEKIPQFSRLGFGGFFSVLLQFLLYIPATVVLSIQVSVSSDHYSTKPMKLGFFPPSIAEEMSAPAKYFLGFKCTCICFLNSDTFK